MSSEDSVEASKHHCSEQLLSITLENSLVSDISHGRSESEIKISAVNDSSIAIIGKDRGTESTEFIGILSKQKHFRVDPKAWAHSDEFLIVLWLNPPEHAGKLLHDQLYWPGDKFEVLVDDIISWFLKIFANINKSLFSRKIKVD